MIFIVLGTLYSVTTPAFEAGDELWHYPFVKHLADGKGLPILEPNAGGDRYNQEGGQPPLYYTIGALATFWIDTGPESDIYQRNPHASIGIPLRSDNKNMVIHTDRENFPYTGVFLALHIVRFLSVLMGAATVYITYLIGLELFPGEPFIGLVAATFNALLPEFLFISGSVNNDNLVITLCSAALLLIIRATKRQVSGRAIILLSLAVGLAALTKLSGIGLIPLVSLVAAAECARRRTLAPLLKLAIPVWVSSAVIAGWWYLRNCHLYGDPLGLNVFLQRVGERPQRPSFLEILTSEGEGLRLSFWGVFGGFNVLASSIIYNLLDALLILAAIGLVLYAVRRQIRQRYSAEYYPAVVALLWLQLVFAAFLRWTQMTLASQGRLIFPALSTISVVFALGIRSLSPRSLIPVFNVGLFLLMAAASLAVPFTSIVPAYTRPVILSEEDLQIPERPLGLIFDEKVKLLGVDIPSDRVSPGENLTLTLYLVSLAEMDRDYSIFVHVFDSSGELVGHIDSYPGGGALPTRLWKPGQALKDTYSVPIAGSVVGPHVLRVEVGFYSLHDMAPLHASDPAGNSAGTSPLVTRVKLIDRHPTKPAPPAVFATLGSEVALVEYDVSANQVAPGEVLKGRLMWQALRKPDKDYTVFVQLVNDKGLVEQFDSYPREGTYPTSFWDEGEIVEDWFEINLDPKVPEGEYILIAGMYDLVTGNRLPVGTGDFIKLQQIAVKR